MRIARVLDFASLTGFVGLTVRDLRAVAFAALLGAGALRAAVLTAGFRVLDVFLPGINLSATG